MTSCRGQCLNPSFPLSLWISPQMKSLCSCKNVKAPIIWFALTKWRDLQAKFIKTQVSWKKYYIQLLLLHSPPKQFIHLEFHITKRKRIHKLYCRIHFFFQEKKRENYQEWHIRQKHGYIILIGRNGRNRSIKKSKKLRKLCFRWHIT